MPWRHMEGAEAELHSFFTLECKKVVNTPAALPLVPIEWGWMGPGAGLDVLKKSKISFLYRVSNPGPSSP